MRLTSLSLTRFRNFEAGQAEFASGLNLVSGANGQGKTNLLEAIHFACLAHSQRTRKDRELIRWGDPSFVLRLEGEIGGRDHTQSVEYSESGHKRVKVDGRESRRLSDLLGHFSLVSFSPEDLDLVRGGAQLRRRYLDVLLCQFSPEYLDALRRYNAVVKQRNSLLRQIGRRGAGEGSSPAAGGAAAAGGAGWIRPEPGALPIDRYGSGVLEAFDDPLVEHGARITLLRRRALAELAPLAREAYHFIADAGEELSLRLIGSVSDAEGGSGPAGGDEAFPAAAMAVSGDTESATGAEKAAPRSTGEEAALRAAFRRKLESLRAAEREAGLTLAGPHREDLALDLEGRPARDFGSQGQKRSTALSLKLASARMLEAKRGHPPILLLDDVFAELDAGRRRRIGEMVQGKGQVFIADPRASDLPFIPDRNLHIEGGTVR